ncbi:MAG: MobA/MobL family protein, partial [Bombella sp.]|nr:MobA/MobL family protein [Bombella sp.]
MSVAAQIQRSTVRGCHLNFAVVNRFDKRGHATALKAAAYNGCTRISAFGHRFDFTRKSAEHRGHYVFMPENVGRQEWLMDPAKTWTRATELERQANGQVARQIQFSLPRELAES